MEWLYRRIGSRRLRMSLIIKPLKAFHGDSILLSFDDNGTTRNILIDGGPGNTYSKPPKALKNEIEQIEKRGENIDLLVITHIDDDHIGGIISIFEYEDPNLDKIKKVWFNSGELISTFFKTRVDPKRENPLILISDPDMSINQGITLENSLKMMNCWEREVIYSGCDTVRFYGSNIIILSPNKKGLRKLNKKWEKEEEGEVDLTGDYSDYKIPISKLITRRFKEDKSVPNESSISFLFECQGKKILFLADSYPSVAAGSIKKLGYSSGKKLELDMVKIAHHGSKRNISPGLLKLIKCRNYLISTNGQMHGFPDKEAMARIIAANKEKTCFYFNYDIAEDIFLPEDYRYFDFECKFLNSEGIELF
jgi:beta-lactamase superfamily II metal-dependent hydrolase